MTDNKSKPGTEVSTEVNEQANTGGITAAEKIEALASGAVTVFSTFVGDSQTDKLKIYDAISTAEPIADHLGETIMLSNAVAQLVEVADEQGELQSAVRVILVDADGSAYAAISDGLYKAMVTLFGLLGSPSTWTDPVAVRIVEQRSRKGFRFYTIKTA